MGASKWTTLAVALLASPSIGATVLDFNDVSPGTVITNQYLGVTFALVGSPPIAGPRAYALQDTLGNPQFIFGASGNAITPADNVGAINPPFFDFQMSFSAPVNYFSILVLDAEEQVSAHAFLGSVEVGSATQGTFLGFNSASVFNGPVYRLEVGQVDGSLRFDRVVIALTPGDGPEVFDNVAFNSATTIPEPNLAALIAVLAIGLLVSRRPA